LEHPNDHDDGLSDDRVTTISMILEHVYLVMIEQPRMSAEYDY